MTAIEQHTKSRNVESHDVVLMTLGIFAAKTREETSEHVERDMAISY